MRFFTALIVILFPITSFSSEFRDTTWGMTKDQVKKTEKLDVLQEKPDHVSYLETVTRYPVVVVYKFADDKLIWGSYSFQQFHEDHNLYVKDFDEFENAITSKYGKARVLDKWVNEHSEHKQDKAAAIKAGDLIQWRTWETPNTMIKLIMFGYNNEFNIDVYYFSKKYRDKSSGLVVDIQNDKF